MTENQIITFNEFAELMNRWKIKLLAIVVGENAPLNGVQLNKAVIPRTVLIGPILRGNQIILPHGSTIFHTNDQIMVFCKEKDIEAVKNKFKNITIKQKIKNFFSRIIKQK